MASSADWDPPAGGGADGVNVPSKPRARSTPQGAKSSKTRRPRASIKLLSKRVDNMFLDYNGGPPSNYAGKDIVLIEGHLHGLTFETLSLSACSRQENYDCDLCSVRVNNGPDCMASFGCDVAIFVNVETRVLSMCKIHKSRVDDLAHLPKYREHPAFERHNEVVHHDGLCDSWWTVMSIGDGGADQTCVAPLDETYYRHGLRPVTYHQSPVTNRRFRIFQGRHHKTLGLALANAEDLLTHADSTPCPFDYCFFAQIDNQPMVRLLAGWPEAGRCDILQAPACRVPVPQWPNIDDCLLLVLPDRFAFVHCRLGSATTETVLREARGVAIPPKSKSDRLQCCLAGSKLFVLAGAGGRIAVYTVSVLPTESDGLEIVADEEWTRRLASLPPTEYITPLGPDRFLIMNTDRVLALLVSE